MDKDMLMGELHIYEFGCRNILYLILESFSICCPCQKRLVRMVYYSKILKPNILLRKLKQRKKERKRKEVWVKDQYRKHQ